ncbi:MAG TPA: hypothetical protein VHW24_17415 [Bryobacteraceae bacterium]|nr:hypothetical protein [Bryobacteraceae bacterium]
MKIPLALFVAAAGLPLAAQIATVKTPEMECQSTADATHIDTPPAEQNYTAMTGSQRWTDFVSGSVASPVVAARVLLSAGISHVNREPVSWGMGPRGYFERVGSHYLRTITAGGIHDGLAAALGHDTRYYRQPAKTGWQRTRHAFRRTFFTRDREGAEVLDISNLTSIYATPLIGSSWHPRHENLLMQGAHQGSIRLSMEMATNLAREFGPDVKRRLLRK